MKVYINCPGNAETGGIESLIQLCDTINNLGGEGIMIWGPRYNGELDPWIHPKYKHYNTKESFEVEDISENVIVYPEIWSDKIDTYKNIKKCIWWLSVDNNQDKFKDFSNPNITHFYQSNYALDYLRRNGAIKYLPLYDYISKKYILKSKNPTIKSNIVCFNPSKGYEVTSQLISRNPDITFVPLVNMSEDEVISTLKKSKIYIDFGHHPGKDKFPREAALMDNIIISGIKGSAMFYNDLPIDSTKYKFNLDEIESASKTIEECLNNYSEKIKDFKLYKNIILNQKDESINQVKQNFLIGKENNEKEIIDRSIASDLGENVYILNEKIKKIKNGVLVDLGVRAGYSSEIMLIDSGERKNKVFGVDVDFSQLMDQLKYNTNYNSILGDSVTVGKNWKGNIDFLFVDTFHIKDQVMCELFYWYPHLKIGSVIAFHDSNWPDGKRDTYGGIQWGRVEEGIMEFFGINSLNYEDEFIKVENYPGSWGMTFVTIKNIKDYRNSQNWRDVFDNRNKLIGMFWNEENSKELEIDLYI
jgi:predicted O-methyltransferase YrrM